MTDDKMREAYETQFCPYRGSPDPWVVWQAAWKAAQARPVDAPTDAERYKWLRSQIRPEYFTAKRRVYIAVDDWAKNLGDDSGPWSCATLTGDEADKAIDAAMRATPSGGGEGDHVRT